ncbi:hypothetical protein GCM10010191_80730 [Actinomadura vinacea]|uniref:Radical SAM core domain-containing protein n=1 Tax=Actinomadura vinacea TaxID=115336 RepID=A0ABN3K9R0_9ACTN
MTAVIESSSTQVIPPYVSIDLTRKCQLQCSHCYNSSGPDGDHGTMSREDWIRVINQVAAIGAGEVRFIGGEPTMHPDGPRLVREALRLGLRVELFSNLVRIPDEWWGLFGQDGVSLATSYYSDDPDRHNAITGRRSHQRTRENIRRAVEDGIPIRVGIVDIADSQRVKEARNDLNSLGVARIHTDRIRAFGRGSQGQAPDISQLCGQCGTGRAAIGPNGAVSPCVMAHWLRVGNVHDSDVATILNGTAMAEANASIQAASRSLDCDPDGECSPGHPSGGCSPRT